jgi:hypothetical protein
MFIYDYEIIYKKGKENVVVDALSKKYEDEGSLFSLSFIVVDWLKAVSQEWFQDPKISFLIQQLQQYPNIYGYTWKNEELLYKGRIFEKTIPF